MEKGHLVHIMRTARRSKEIFPILMKNTSLDTETTTAGDRLRRSKEATLMSQLLNGLSLGGEAVKVKLASREEYEYPRGHIFVWEI